MKSRAQIYIDLALNFKNQVTYCTEQPVYGENDEDSYRVEVAVKTVIYLP